jgi:hypothetical protein
MPGTQRQQRFDLAALTNVAPGSSITELSLLLGVARQVIYRWQLDGIPYWAADRAAIAIGLHPVIIWPDFHETTDISQLKDTA